MAPLAVLSLGIPVPASVQSGDLLVAQVAAGGGSTLANITASGWTALPEEATGSLTGMTVRVLYKIADGDDAGGTVNFGLGVSLTGAGTISAYRGVDTSDPVAASGSANGSGTTALAPSVTATEPASTVLAMFATDGNRTISPQAPGGAVNWVQRWSASNAQSLAGASDERASAGATGTRSASIGGGSADWVTYTFAINPAP